MPGTQHPSARLAALEKAEAEETAEWEAFGRELAEVRRECEELKREIRARQLDCKWDGQPRDHGRYSFGKMPRLVSQAAALRRLGHHYVPRQVYKNRRLREDTRKVFEETTSGRLDDTRINMFDSSHRAYNKAVNEQFDRFLTKKSISEEQMTPQHAHEFLGEILTSRDPRIRNFNMRIWMRQILRGGRFRGNE